MTGHETAGGEQPPVVTAIHIAPASRLPMRAAESVQVEAGRGIVGDRYHGTKHRHVTVQSQTALDAATEDLGSPVEPGGTRRNITISHGDVPTTPGQRLRIGAVDLEVVRVAAPCKLLDDVIGSGARTALRGRAGSVCRALSTGSIAVGDPVRLAPPDVSAGRGTAPRRAGRSRHAPRRGSERVTTSPAPRVRG